MKKIIFMLVVITANNILAQVGIGTTSPNALLDVVASNPSAPASTDGILVPRIDTFPVTSPTINQDGMIIYLTTDKTFYVWEWDAINPKWTPFVKRINDLEDGRSDYDGTNNFSSLYLGYNAGLNDDLTDNKNIGIGYNAMNSNTNGQSNIAIGIDALSNSSIANYNIAIGNQTLKANTGNDNVAIGDQALTLNTSGANNTAIGSYALAANLTGTNNVAIGADALATNNAGYNNIAIGFSALNLNEGGFSNTAIGRYALGENTTGDSNTSLGNNTLFSNEDGSGNTAIGDDALDSNVSGNNNTAVGKNANGSSGFSNTTALGYNTTITANNQIRLGNASITEIGGYDDWLNVTSDRRVKKNIKENVAGLSFIKKLRPVTYNLDMDAIAKFNKTPDNLRLWNAEKEKEKIVQIGFIAQEVEQAAESENFDFHAVKIPKNQNEHYGIRYAEFVAPLVKAVQEQQVIIENQEAKINKIDHELKKQTLENEHLNKKISILEAQLNLQYEEIQLIKEQLNQK